VAQRSSEACALVAVQTDRPWATPGIDVGTMPGMTRPVRGCDDYMLQRQSFIIPEYTNLIPSSYLYLLTTEIAVCMLIQQDIVLKENIFKGSHCGHDSNSDDYSVLV
jgi:hypothetical protein